MSRRKSKTPKKDSQAPRKKDKYRIRNWRQYNESLINRGSITFWFSEDAIEKWHAVKRTGKPGRPETYSDDAIRCGLMIKAVFRIALRALQGFIKSLIINLATKLFNAATQTMQALTKYRAKGQQTVQVIHVHNEGQAIVAQNLSTMGGGVEKKSRVEPHGSL